MKVSKKIIIYIVIVIFCLINMSSVNVPRRYGYWSDIISVTSGQMVSLPGYYLSGFRYRSKDEIQLYFASHDNFDRSSEGHIPGGNSGAVSGKTKKNYFNVPNGYLIAGFSYMINNNNNEFEIHFARNRSADLRVELSRRYWSSWIEPGDPAEFTTAKGDFIIGIQCSENKIRFLAAPLAQYIK